MAWIYIIRGSTGRHYIGSTVDLDARLVQDSVGMRIQQNGSVKI
jgi:predicted GIY-YIG superfamily endonuclease